MNLGSAGGGGKTRISGATSRDSGADMQPPKTRATVRIRVFTHGNTRARFAIFIPITFSGLPTLQAPRYYEAKFMQIWYRIYRLEFGMALVLLQATTAQRNVRFEST